MVGIKLGARVGIVVGIIVGSSLGVLVGTVSDSFEIQIQSPFQNNAQALADIVWEAYRKWDS